jgi:hypothetical protein
VSASREGKIQEWKQSTQFGTLRAFARADCDSQSLRGGHDPGGVHVALLAFDPHALLLSNLLIPMFDLLGLTVRLLGASSESPETRPLWLLFGCGLLLFVVGQLGR